MYISCETTCISSYTQHIHVHVHTLYMYYSVLAKTLVVTDDFLVPPSFLPLITHWDILLSLSLQSYISLQLSFTYFSERETHTLSLSLFTIKSKLLSPNIKVNSFYKQKYTLPWLNIESFKQINTNVPASICTTCMHNRIRLFL